MCLRFGLFVWLMPLRWVAALWLLALLGLELFAKALLEDRAYEPPGCVAADVFDQQLFLPTAGLFADNLDPWASGGFWG